MNQNTNADKMGVMVVEFVVKCCIVLRLGGGCYLLQKKYIMKKKKWGRGREGQSPGHKLTDNITDKIIMSETLTEKI